MGVVLGTLTTKDGQVIPLPTAADALDEPVVDEYRKEEERKYSKCIHRPVTHGVWDNSWQPKPVTRPVALYLLKTQNLRLQGETMKPKSVYNTNQYKVFEYIFKHPNEWLDTEMLSKAIGMPRDSASASMTYIRRFLKDEELAVEKDKEGTSGKGKCIMFKAVCEDPVAESKLWYSKFLDYRKRANKKPAAKGANPQPQAVAATAPKTSSPVTPVQVDTSTMEAIVRVPLAKLASVLKLLTS
jgi:hypothetical protein